MKKKVKITDLSEATVLEGLYILGVNASNQGVKAAMSLLKGLDGKEVEMRVTATALQYRLTGGTWKELLTISVIQKPAVDAAKRADEKMVQLSEDVSQKISELNSTNESVQDAEDLRDTAETQRKAAEQARLTAETNRDVEEGKRVISEKKRATDEEVRNTEELERIESEKNRIEEEKKRVLTETGRTEAENKRQMDTTEAVDRLDSLSDHRDEIRDGYWWHWNETTKEYEKTENRADGNTLFASFELDPLTGELSVTTPDGYDGPTFELDNRGYLSVIV